MDIQKKDMNIKTETMKIANRKCRLYTLSNKSMNVKILSIGATLIEINTPDRNGNLDNIILKHNDLLSYSANLFYFGATIGRTTGRIKNGQIKLSDKVYQLVKNNAGNTLHGGKRGFSLVSFEEYRQYSTKDSVTLILCYESKDLEEGYPGNLHLEVWFTLNNKNEFTIEYKANTNKETVCNISNHAYFNLNHKKSILEESLIVNANEYYDNLGGLILGKKERVDNTPFDFRVEQKVGYALNNPLLHVYTNGYDHLFVFNDDDEHIIFKDYDSGRMMTIYSTYKACHIFNFEFKKRDSFYSGICFECQKLPYKIENDENEIVLKPNQEYDEKIVYKFDIME